MDDFEVIRKELRKAAENKKEQEALLALFDAACAGLADGMTRGVKAELEKRFDGLIDEIEAKAETVEKRIKG